MKKRILFLIIVWSIKNLSAQNPTIQVSPLQQTIIPTQSATYHIDVLNTGGFSQQLFFNISFTTIPVSNCTFSFFPNPLNYPYTGGTDLTIQTNGGIPIGNYTVIVEASNGPVTSFDTCYLNVVSPSCYWTSYQFPNSYYPSYHLTVDFLGNKWIPGLYDLIKYDGANWTEYNSSNSNYPNGGSIASKLAVDLQNNIWMPMQSHGLVKFDGTFWTVYNTSNSAIPSDSLLAIVVDSAQNKWIATRNIGIAKFDGTSWTNYNSSNSPLPNNCIKKLSLDNFGNLWMAGYASYSSSNATFLGKFDGTTWTFYNSANACFLFSCIMSNLVFDQNNNLWFSAGIPAFCGGSSNGLIKFDGSNWEVWQDSTTTPFNHYIKNISCSVSLQDNQSKLPVTYSREVFIDNNNTTWVANLDNLPGAANGLTKFDGVTWRTFTPTNSNLPKIAIRGISYSNDTLWVISSPNFYNNPYPNYLAAYYCNVSTSLQHEQSFKNDIKVFPNPFTTETTFSFNKQLSNALLEISDMTGRKVQSFKVNGQYFQLNRSQLDNGIYFYHLVEAGQITNKGKIISE